jgi:hypothetical protein
LSLLVAQFWLITATALTKPYKTRFILHKPVVETLDAMGPLDWLDTGGIFGCLCYRLSGRFGAAQVARYSAVLGLLGLNFDHLLDLLDGRRRGSFGDFLDHALGLFDFDPGGSFDRFDNQLLGPIDFDTGGNFQQLQQWGIDAGNGIYPAFAQSPIARWEHVKLVSDFFELGEALFL